MVDWCEEEYSSEEELDSDEEEDCPTTLLEYQRRTRQKKDEAALEEITDYQVLGVTNNFMVRRLNQLWKLKSPFMVTDPGNEFFLVKFES